MVVRELVAMLGLKTDPAGFKGAEGGFKNIIKFAKIAAVAVAAVKLAKWARDAAEQVANLADKFDKMALRTGQSFEQLQKWSFAAELSGADIATVETSLKKLQAAQIEAADGTATYLDEFKRLGVEVKDTNGEFKDTEELLIEMADKFNDLGSDAERTNVAMRLMGRGGTQLIPMFKAGTAAIKEMMEEAKQLGGVIGDDLRQAGTKYIDNQSRMNQITQGFKNAVAKGLLPHMIKLQDNWINFVKANGEFIRQNIERVVGGIVRVFAAFSKHLDWAVSLVTDWIQGWDDTTKKIAAVGVAIVALGALIMTGPVGLIILLIALVGLAIEDFQTWKEGGDSLFGSLIKWLDDVLGIDIVKWVNDAEKHFATFFKLVDDLLVDSTESLFHFVDLLNTPWSEMDQGWSTFVGHMGDIWDTEHNGMAKITADFVKNDLPDAWGGFKLFMHDLWKTLILDFEINIIGKIVSSIKKAVAFLRRSFALKNFVRAPGSGGVVDGLKAVTAPAGTGPAQFGPTIAGPMAAGAGGFGPTALTNVEMTINAAPGMDEKKVAQHVAKEVQKASEAGRRDAMAALVPQAG